MKTLITILLLSALPCLADFTATNLFTLQTVTGTATNYSASFGTSKNLGQLIAVAPVTFLIQNNGLPTGTNNFDGQFEVTFDGTNYAPVMGKRFTTTNPAIDSVTVDLSTLTPAVRFRAITLTNMQIGVTGIKR